MDFIIYVIITVIVILIYLHVIREWTRSEDLEIYEMDYTNNTHLQTVCNIRQPVLFNLSSAPIFNEFTADILENIENFDVVVKDSQDYYNIMERRGNGEKIFPTSFILPYRSFHKLKKTDTSSKYYTENNYESIEDFSLFKKYCDMDDFLKPPFVIQSKYDLLMGSPGTYTPLHYHTHGHQFFAVISGKIKIKMSPWKSSKYLYPYKNYKDYIFGSPVNIWNPQQKYIQSYEKMKCLEFDVPNGYIVYIPPYWWYSIKYDETDENTIIAGFSYTTAINFIANMYDNIIYWTHKSVINDYMPLFILGKENVL